jgi:hypothetical protein
MGRLLPQDEKSTLLYVGFLIGIIVFWFIAAFVHVPGTYTVAPVLYVPNSNTGNTQNNNPSVGSSETSQGNSLPRVIPVYTPSTVTAFANQKEVLGSPSPTYTVINYYGEVLSKNGWKITTESTENGSTTINASGNGYTMSVSITSYGSNGSQFTIQTS